MGLGKYGQPHSSETKHHTNCYITFRQAGATWIETLHLPVRVDKEVWCKAVDAMELLRIAVDAALVILVQVVHEVEKCCVLEYSAERTCPITFASPPHRLRIASVSSMAKQVSLRQMPPVSIAIVCKPLVQNHINVTVSSKQQHLSNHSAIRHSSIGHTMLPTTNLLDFKKMR